MSQPTQMEKLEEIVRALESEVPAHLVECGRLRGGKCDCGQAIHESWGVMRALTLARELRDNAVEGTVPIPVVMALCEQDSLILRPNVLYRFEPVDGCARCAEIMGTYAGHEWTTVGSTDPNP